MGELLRPPPSPFVPFPGSNAAPARGGALHPAEAAASPQSLKILHVLRAPVGGLFRHVLDVAQGQAERGHRVGIVADSLTGGDRADEALARLAPHLALGVARVAIARHIGSADIGAWRRVARRIAALKPDVLHGHGAKGAALARLAPHDPNTIRVYTPHGGTLVFGPGTLAGAFYRSLERLLNRRTELFLFESDYIADAFRAQIGPPRGMIRVVRNGVSDAEFATVSARADATDIVCLGEMRRLKGIDILIAALAMLKQNGRIVSATVAGEGPQRREFEALTARSKLADQIRFVGHRSAREAFAMGRILVMPSRAESLPYVVLEAAAAGLPIVATRVGGIPEIFGPEAFRLIAPEDAPALAGAIAAALDDPEQSRRIAAAVTARVRSEFSIDVMVDGGLAAYREALTMRKVAQFA